MYMMTSFLSPAKACLGPQRPPRVIKKVPWGGQGRLPKTRLPNSYNQSEHVWLKGDLSKTSLLKTNFNSKFMEYTLRTISNDIWESLGPGYSESVYHCAFEVALRSQAIYYETERIVPVYYAGLNVGHVRADLIIDRKVVVELKSVSKLNETYRIQTRNYLTLLELKTGYLINFPDKNGPMEFEEIVLNPPPPMPLEMIDC